MSAAQRRVPAMIRYLPYKHVSVFAFVLYKRFCPWQGKRAFVLVQRPKT